MVSDKITIKYIGGATALLEIGGLRFLTDPTLDPKDSEYDTGLCILHKLMDPSPAVSKLGKIDFVLLSHDHHLDNLDHAGQKFLSSVDKVFTTPIGAKRLGENSVGLKN